MSAVEIDSEPAPERRAVLPDAPLLRTVVIAELDGASSMPLRLGDVAAIDLFRRLDRIARELLARHGGCEIDKTDGVLCLFERPIRGIGFALDLQRALREMSTELGLPLAARIGIHVGDVLVWSNSAQDVAHGAKPIEVEGLVKPIAARLMGLARPGQILLTGVANTLAQRGLRELGPRAQALRFKSYGRYVFKGVAEALPIYEVGEPGIAPLKRPPAMDKAKRELPWWRRPRALALELAAGAGALAVALWVGGHPQPAIAFDQRDWIVIGDLRNLSGVESLDESLQTALYISLEQSRFVNVVPDLQVRGALARMQRAAGTPVDRAVGAEIALREGARALIVPTVAQVGGRLRVSAEVVDPHTQATVFVAFADGSSPAEALPAVDQVTRRLRGSLGEAVRSIDSDSMPLPKVATTNIEALRVYAAALREQVHGRYAQAIELYRQAIALDPGFALAYMGLARVHYAADDRPAAFADLAQARAHPDRLTTRDKLYLEAWATHFGPPTRALQKWKLLGTLYPDFYAAFYNYAHFAAMYANRHAEALDYSKRAISEHNYHLPSAHYQTGAWSLALEQTGEALKHFRKAEALGIGGSLREYAYAFAVTRDYAQAERVLAATKPTGVASDDIFGLLPGIILAADRGDQAQALRAAHAATAEAEKVGTLYGRVFRGIELTLAQLSEPKARVRESLRSFAETELAAASRSADLDRNHAVFAAAAAAYLAARSGETALARRTLVALEPMLEETGFPNAQNLFAIARAELRRAEGDTGAALAGLDRIIDGNELYQAHVARLNALTDAGRNGEALREAEWLAAHRGKAFVENGSYHLLNALNATDSNLAQLRAAELKAGLDRADDALRTLAEFRRQWPEAEHTEFVASRVKQLSAALRRP